MTVGESMLKQKKRMQSRTTYPNANTKQWQKFSRFWYTKWNMTNLTFRPFTNVHPFQNTALMDKAR